MMRPRSGRRLAMRAAAAAAAALLLPGCAALTITVPTSGPIEQGDQVVVRDSADQFIRVIARPPVPGMTPLQIVQGFLDASASFEGNHATARQYLTAEARQTWDPRSGVLVYDGALDFRQVSDRVSIGGLASGRITREGHFEVAWPGQEVSEEFSLAYVDGEWRIARAPSGLVLARADVDRAFRTYSVYFFDPDFSTLVPDLRTIPVQGQGLATALMTILLDGPTDWLAPAVRTAVPQGTTLAIDAVTVEDGVARVALSTGVRALGSAALQALSAQITWTLSELPDVSYVELSSGGQPLIVPGAPARQSTDIWSDVSPSGPDPGAGIIAVRDGRVVAHDDTGIARPVGPWVDEGRVRVERVAMSPDRESLAAVDTRGRLWLASGDALQQVGIARASAPSIDRTGTVWTTDSRGAVFAVDRAGSAYAVDVEGLPPRSSVTSVAVARDGTRAVLVVQANGGTVLMLARIVRDAGSVPTISAPQRIEQRLIGVADVSWAGADSLAVLATEGVGPVQPFVLTMPRGSLRALAAVERPRSIAAAPDRPVIVATESGKILQNTVGVWTSYGQGRSPAYAGG